MQKRDRYHIVSKKHNKPVHPPASKHRNQHIEILHFQIHYDAVGSD